MNQLDILQDFNVEVNSLCQYSLEFNAEVNSYYELVKILVDNNYEYEPGHILLDAKSKTELTDVGEEVLATPKSLIYTSDDTPLKWDEIYFILKKYCDNKSVIRVRDQGEYCEDCYKKMFPQFPKIEDIKVALNITDKTLGLSVSKKIQYILKNGGKMTSSEIYKEGCPWVVQGTTPKNTIAARCSTLYNKGVIKKEKNRYYL